MRTKATYQRRIAAAAIAAAMLGMQPQPAASAAHAFVRQTSAPLQHVARPSASPGAVLWSKALPGGRTATVYSNGIASIESKDGKHLEYRPLPGAFDRFRPGTDAFAQSGTLLAELAKPNLPAYAPNRIVVVFKSGVSVTQDVVSVPSTTLAALRGPRAASVAIPTYSTDYAVNRVFARLGVDRVARVARGLSRSSMAAMRFAGRPLAPGATPLDLSNAFTVHLSNASVPNALRALRGVASIAYAGPDVTVRTMNTTPVPLPKEMRADAERQSSRVTAQAVAYHLPNNFGLAASGQALLDATGINAAAAYDEIYRRFGQIPGEGEIITNVSVGDVDDASALDNINDNCWRWVEMFGPTTRMIGGQRYLDLPSMPLIPVYTAAPDASLSSQEVCGLDPVDGEIGLDFSMMAPLPHALQRGGAVGTGFTDLLGVAPGATYRLVVPASTKPTTSDLVAALLAAANQSPAPNVITASLGFGMDAEGFPGRFFEDDPLVQSTIAQIVAKNIVVCISANDGLRTYTNAPVGPSGGSAPTNLTTDATQATTIGDVEFSTAPSLDIDSGAIDVGGTTLDDIFAVNPSDPANANFPDVRAVPETRFTGFTAFSSGFGSRVNISAPSDNVVALTHTSGGGYNAVDTSLSGGTSASAPEVAAAAAVVLQVARLTGHPFASATDVRALLEQTATPVAQAPQSDVNVNVGPQLNLGAAVEKLLAATGMPVHPGVPRVAVMMRRGGTFNMRGMMDTVFTENADRGYIDLQGPYDQIRRVESDDNAQSYLTIAPDWEALPANAKFDLRVTGTKTPLATTSAARLLPVQILEAAGMTLASTTTRTVNLTYRAYSGLHTIVSSTFDVTFGPADATSELVHAPAVAPVVSGALMHVSYDLRSFPAAQLSNPALVVSFPGRINPATGSNFFAAYETPIPAGATVGSIDVPVSALPGDGLYGVGIVLNQYGLTSDFAPVRVAVAGSARPPAPVFVEKDPTTGATMKTHYGEMSYGTSFTLSYDVSNVSGATGAMLEISAGGPGFYGNMNPFNNPNGDVADANGFDSGSVYRQILYGTTGTVTLDPTKTGVIPALAHVVRVIPLAGSTPAGEASDVSFLTEDGVVPSDGGTVDNGYGINPQGNDGLLTSYQWLANGDVMKSVERFAQDTLATGATLAASSATCNSFFVPSNAFFGNDTGLIGNWDQLGCTTLYPLSYNTVPNVATATTTGPAYSPPFPSVNQMLAATNSISGEPSGKGAFLAARYDQVNGGIPQATTFMSDVANGTFTAPIDLDALNFVNSPLYRTMDFDSGSSLGYIIVDAYPWFGMHPATSVVVANYGTGTATRFYANGCGGAEDFELDPGTHLGVMTTRAQGCSANNALQVLNLATSRATSVGVGGLVPPTMVSVDPVNHLFFVQVPVTANAAYDNNALSSVVITDESGNVRSTIQAFNFMNSVLGNHFFEIDPALRRGYVFGPNFTEIQPFTY